MKLLDKEAYDLDRYIITHLHFSCLPKNFGIMIMLQTKDVASLSSQSPKDSVDASPLLADWHISVS